MEQRSRLTKQITNYDFYENKSKSSTDKLKYIFTVNEVFDYAGTTQADIVDKKTFIQNIST